VRIIFRCRFDGVLGEDRVDLADGLGQALLHAHGQDPLHCLDPREDAFDRHSGGARLRALRPGHVVLDAAAGRQAVLGEGGGIGRRTPPALDLARIGPKLPHPLGCRIERGLQGDGHRSLSFVSLII